MDCDMLNSDEVFSIWQGFGNCESENGGGGIEGDSTSGEGGGTLLPDAEPVCSRAIV